MSDSTTQRHQRGDHPELRTPRGLLALQALPKVGPANALRAAFLTTNFDALMEAHGNRWQQALETAQRELDEAERHGVTALCLFDKRYPARLRAIHDPPPVLFIHGSMDVLNQERLAAVVGTREPSSFGCSA